MENKTRVHTEQCNDIQAVITPYSLARRSTYRFRNRVFLFVFFSQGTIIILGQQVAELFSLSPSMAGNGVILNRGIASKGLSINDNHSWQTFFFFLPFDDCMVRFCAVFEYDVVFFS